MRSGKGWWHLKHKRQASDSVANDPILTGLVNEQIRAVFKHAKSGDLRDAEEAARCRWAVIAYVDILVRRARKEIDNDAV